MRKPQPSDLYLFKLIHQARTNGRLTAFTVTEPKENEYVSNIWLSDGSRTWQFTRSGSDSSPAWSPDGSRLAFLSRRGARPEDKWVQLMLSDFNGEPRALVKREGISSIQWSRDGRFIYFLAPVGKIDDDVKIIDRIPIWFNGRGYTYGVYTHLFRVDAETGDAQQLTSGDFNVVAFDVLDNIVMAVSSNELRPFETEIRVLSGSGMETIKSGALSVSSLAWLPSGDGLLAIGHDLHRGTVTHNRLLRIGLDGSIKDLLGDFPLEVGNSLNSDMRGSPPDVKVELDGSLAIFPVNEAGSVNLYGFDLATGQLRRVTEGEWSIESFSSRGGSLVFTAMNAASPAELFMREGNSVRRITSFNDGVVSSLQLANPTHIRFTASDGVSLDAWVLSQQSTGKLPAIVEIHGGPKTMYGNAFMFEFHVLSGDFMVIYMNPRGSAGYSEDFADIRGHYGERDYLDIMEGLSHIISRFPVDSSRVGVIGGSYGGFMVNWIITHTRAFKAAVSERSISNWLHFFGTSDIGFFFGNDHVGGNLDADPWSNRDKFIEKSPVIHVKYVETPVMIIHSLEDYRCYVGEALQFYTALKYNGKKARLVLFPGENHDLSRTGKPSHRVERLNIIRDWFINGLAGNTLKQ